MSDLFGMVTCEQASAGLSAIGCPTHHANAVPVENLDGERVATLCPGCDRQLPADWKTAEERALRRPPGLQAGMAGRLMQIGLGRFSSYLVDVDALMSEMERKVNDRFTTTARWPCAVRLNPLDLDAALKRYGMPPAAPDVLGRLFGTPVIGDEDQKLGTIEVTQCETSLYQPGKCDCPAPSVNPA
jgi:hypothetical protein